MKQVPPHQKHLQLSSIICTINLALSARARAFMSGRAFVTPQDIKDMVHSVLRHRILVTYEAEAENINTDTIISRLLTKIAVP